MHSTPHPHEGFNPGSPPRALGPVPRFEIRQTEPRTRPPLTEKVPIIRSTGTKKSCMPHPGDTLAESPRSLDHTYPDAPREGGSISALEGTEATRLTRSWSPSEEIRRFVAAAAASPPDKRPVTERVSAGPGDASQEGALLPAAVTHTVARDIVINNRHPDPEQARSTMQTLAEGIPASWPRIYPRSGPDPERPKEYYMDSPEHPTVFVKVRGSSQLRFEQEMQAIRERPEHEQYKQLLRREARIDNSVLHGLNTAPAVQAALDTDEVSQFVAERGFEGGIRVELPLGVVVEKDGSKLVAFRWLDGYRITDTQADGSPVASEAEIAAIHEIGTEVDEILTERGFIPKGVTNPEHYIIWTDPATGKRNLHLIDTEDIYRRPKKQPI